MFQYSDQADCEQIFVVRFSPFQLEIGKIVGIFQISLEYKLCACIWW